MKLDDETLNAAHRACVSAQTGATSDDFNTWLQANDIDLWALMENASVGGSAWVEAYGGEESQFTSAIIAGFEWGYRAREMQELFS